MKYILILIFFASCYSVPEKEICTCPVCSANAAEIAIIESYADSYFDSIRQKQILDSIWENDPPME